MSIDNIINLSFSNATCFVFLQIPSFQLYWDRFVQVGMGFDEYEVLYPDVPLQPPDNMYVTLSYMLITAGYSKIYSPRLL